VRPLRKIHVGFVAALVRLLGDLERRRATTGSLERCAKAGLDARLLGIAWVHGPGRVELGDEVLLDGHLAPIELHALAGGVLSIGDGSILEGGCSIETTQSVRIGARCHLGPFVKVIDNDFHPVHGDRHRRPPARPVVIEDDVTVGDHAILLPGAHLARNSRVAPHEVVERAPTSRSALVIPLTLKRNRTLRARLDRLAMIAWARLLFRHCRLGARVAAEGFVQVDAEGAISIGDRTQFLFGAVPTTLRAHPGAKLCIGEECLANHGITLDAWRSISIGARCMLGDRVRLADTDERGTRPIVIEDDVWLAHGVRIDPGVTVGMGSVVAAGSRVSVSVPAYSIARGDPAVATPLK
jgi:acetyltransferase-like isoleucine patch superfamily enzyme